MAGLLLGVSGLFAGLSVLRFSFASLIYLVTFAAIPVVASIDLGPGLPLLTLQRLLAWPLVLGLAVQLSLSKSNLARLPLIRPLFLLLIAYSASSAFSTAPSIGSMYRVFAVMAEDVGVYVLAYAVLISPERLSLFRLGTVCVLLAVLGFMAYELLSGHNPVAEAAVMHRDGLMFDYSLGERFGLRRLQSWFRNPLDLGVYMLLTVPVAWTMVRRQHAPTLIACVLAIAGCALGAVLTGSRMVIYTFVIMAASWVFFSGRWRTGLIAGTAGLCLVSVVAWYTRFPIWEYLVGSAVNPELYQSVVGGSSLHSLLRVTGEHVQLGLQRPLVGWGVGTFPPNGDQFDPYMVGYGEQGLTHVFAELGVLGFVALLWLFGEALWRLKRGLRKECSQSVRDLSAVSIAMTIGYLASAQLEGVWHLGYYLVLVAAALRAQELEGEVNA